MRDATKNLNEFGTAASMPLLRIESVCITERTVKNETYRVLPMAVVLNVRALGNPAGRGKRFVGDIEEVIVP